MEFVTIHDLSRELNIPARIIRYRLIHLIAEGKLKEHAGFRPDGSKDEHHYVWKIHPLRFMQETGLNPDIPPPADASIPPLVTNINKLDNQPEPVVNQSGNKAVSVDNEPPPHVNQANTKSEERALAREMIDFLKEQIHTKDAQLREQGEQLKETHELNVKLIGTTLQQSQRIESLLRLTGGKSEMSDVFTKDTHSVNQVDNQTPPTDSNVGNEPGRAGYQTDNGEHMSKAA